MPYTVTRQIQWPEGAHVVEVSHGGRDCTNPDALAAKYPWEFSAFDDPREAAQAAIEICRAWRRDGERGAKVAHGATGGMTLPFDPCSARELVAWAKQAWDRLPRCDRCGEVLPVESFRSFDDPDARYCREYCAEMAQAEAA